MDARVERWIERDPDPKTREELRALVAAGDDAELARRFAGRLAFGTAGLRGVLGAGPSRMNRLVVRETSAGLGAYLLAECPDARRRGVVIGYDGRHGSRDFARDAAAVLLALELPVFLGETVLPTPVCAFAVKDLGAVAGIVVTASHNPPQYNGYKVYWGNGAQIIPPHDRGIAAAIAVAATCELPFADIEDLDAAAGKLTFLGNDLIDRYLDGVAAMSVHAPTDARAALGIAYTPLHGVGAPTAEAAMGHAGFTQVRTVAAQREPDGDFPTVSFPNPEEPGAMDAVLALAREMDADLAIANDPDADRLAVAVRESAGVYRMLDGNQVGVLLGADRLASTPPSKQRDAMAATIVSSRMLGVIARAAGAVFIETLTGFKWITNEAMKHEERDALRFLFGYEEALGYSVGTLVRDKDGISALVAFAEYAAALKDRGHTVLNALDALYRAHGLFLTAQRSLALSPGAPPLGDRLRAATPDRIAGRAVESIADYAASVRRHADGESEPIDLPASDVLVFLLAGDARVIVRPSGTEPKLKCYYEVRETIAADEPFDRAEARARRVLEQLIVAHQAQLAALR